MKKISAKKLSKILKYESLKRGMTQEEFAKILKIPRGSLANYMTGKRIPSPSNLYLISSILNIDLAKIIIEDN